MNWLQSKASPKSEIFIFIHKRAQLDLLSGQTRHIGLEKADYFWGRSVYEDWSLKQWSERVLHRRLKQVGWFEKHATTSGVWGVNREVKGQARNLSLPPPSPLCRYSSIAAFNSFKIWWKKAEQIVLTWTLNYFKNDYSYCLCTVVGWCNVVRQFLCKLKRVGVGGMQGSTANPRGAWVTWTNRKQQLHNPIRICVCVFYRVSLSQELSSTIRQRMVKSVRGWMWVWGCVSVFARLSGLLRSLESVHA